MLKIVAALAYTLGMSTSSVQTNTTPARNRPTAEGLANLIELATSLDAAQDRLFDAGEFFKAHEAGKLKRNTLAAARDAARTLAQQHR